MPGNHQDKQEPTQIPRHPVEFAGAAEGNSEDNHGAGAEAAAKGEGEDGVEAVSHNDLNGL